MFHSLLNLSANFWHISFKRRIELENMPILFIVWVLRTGTHRYIFAFHSLMEFAWKTLKIKWEPTICNALLCMFYRRMNERREMANTEWEKINNIKSQLENETHDQLISYCEEQKNIKWNIFEKREEMTMEEEAQQCAHTHTQWIYSQFGWRSSFSHSSKKKSQFGSLFRSLFAIFGFSWSQIVSNNTLRAWCCSMHKHQVHCRVAN